MLKGIVEMSQGLHLYDIDFGQPEAENDLRAIQQSFYEAAAWRHVVSGKGTPFVVGRKGAGKSAIAARLEFLSKEHGECCFIRIVPASFRHVEIRDLLACLVNRTASWQYIYRKVWEGILLGQLVRHLGECRTLHGANRVGTELIREVHHFSAQCSFYVAPLGDALSDVISNYVRGVAKKTDALSQVELRKMLEPYAWVSLISAIQHQYPPIENRGAGTYIVVDGLDEHWDTSAASLYFLAELLVVAKDFNAKFAGSIRFLICLRDSIFRALVDTKSIEYDKIESLIINLEWNSRSLFELIARRVAPAKKIENALAELRSLLPETVGDVATEELIARHVLQRPRDYINFFRMLQEESGSEPKAGEGHIQDALDKYCANRLVDLENEFGFTYPNISKCIASLHNLPPTFNKDTLVQALGELCALPSFRSEAPELVAHYGQPLILARILLSIGAIGTYDEKTHALRFVHEFSESRVAGLWESATTLGIHPVYCYKRPESRTSVKPVIEEFPAIVTHPHDYLAEKDSPRADLVSYQIVRGRKNQDLVASLAAIDKGQPHFRRFESWVMEVLSLCFIGDLVNAEEQITTTNQTKRFEIVFDIMGTEPPWPEITQIHGTRRLLVECKNTEEPSEPDVLKLERDMKALQFNVAFLAYRGNRREPSGKLLEYQRSVFVNSDRKLIIVTLSEIFLLQCLKKKPAEKCRANLNALWRDHRNRWLPT